METKFYDTFQNFSQEDLFKIIFEPENYRPDAVSAARQIITEKNWTNELNRQIEINNKKSAEEQELYEQEIKEKAAYYKNVVEFQNQRNAFQIRIADVPKFEAALSDQGIEYFREDKNIGVQLDSYPTQTYHFKTADAEQVDLITKNLGLVTAPYADARPFFRFEVKVLLIVIALTILLLILF
jgi:hypothetical protein